MAAFKKIPGYSLYEISENGEIRKIVSKEAISQRVHPVYGYKMCDLLDDNLKVHTVYPHKEVARTYIPVNKDARMYVIHLNGNPKDNRLKNLKWATPAEAQVHQVKMGLRKRIGNPELFKFSKFWLAKQNKKAKSKDKPVANKSKKVTVKGKVQNTKAKAATTPKTVTKKAVAAKSKNALKSKPAVKKNAKKQVKSSASKINKVKSSSKKIALTKAGSKQKASVKPAAKAKVAKTTKKAVAKKKAPVKAAKAVKANTKKITAKKADNKKKTLPKGKVKSTKNAKKAVSTKSKKMGENTTMKKVPSKLLKTNGEMKVERKEKRQRIKYKKVISSAGKKTS